MTDPFDRTQPAAKQCDNQPRGVKHPGTTNDQRATEIRPGPVGDHQPPTTVDNQQVPGIEVTVQGNLVVLCHRHVGHGPRFDSPWLGQALAQANRQPQSLVNHRQRFAGPLGHRAPGITTASDQPTPHRFHAGNAFEFDPAQSRRTADQPWDFEQVGHGRDRRSSTRLFGLDDGHRRILLLDHRRGRQLRQPLANCHIGSPICGRWHPVTPPPQ